MHGISRKGNPTCICYWILDPLKTENGLSYLPFLENSISASLPDPQS